MEVDANNHASQPQICYEPDKFLVTSFVLLAPHVIYATISGQSRRDARSFSNSLGLYQLSFAGPPAWVSVPTGKDAEPISMLLGRDGSNIVHISGTVSPM